MKNSMDSTVRTKLILPLALLALFTCSAQSAIQVGGQLLVDLHASRGFFTNTTMAYWTNFGSMGGVFTSDGAVGTFPAATTVAGQNAITFDGGDRLKASFTAPNLLTGQKPNGTPDDYSIEYWVYNPAVGLEEWLLAFSRRGTDARFAGFGYGTHAVFGVAAHWGASDMGFGEGISTAGAASTPPAGNWHHIVVTYDGSIERAYTNAILNAQEPKALNLWNGDPMTVGMAYTYPPIAYAANIAFSGSVKALRVHSGVLTPEQIQNNYVEGLAALGASMQIVGLPASGVWVTNATFNAQLTTANPADVTIYYGTADVKTNMTQWASSMALGPQSSGNLAVTINGLAIGTTYYYRVYVSNETGEAWSAPISFATLGLASISTLPPKTVLPTYARMRGNLSNLNGSATQVRVYWGTTDGGNVAGDWANVTDLGSQGVGELAPKVTGLTPGTTYFYRYYAVNAAGETWASTNQSFTTPTLFSQGGYAYNMQVTFNGYTKTERLTNFPALVVLSSNIANFSYANFLSGTADLRFVDETGGELNYEIESWDPNGSSYVWVQVPELSQGTAIQVYWGKAGLEIPSYTTNGATWNDGFAAVWHMTNALTKDSSGRGWNAVSTRNANAVTTTPGVVGLGQDYAVMTPSGTTVIGNGGDIDLTTQTLSAWVLLRSASRDGAFMAKDGVMFLWQQGTALRFETSPWGGDTTIPAPPTGTWVHFAATASGDGGVHRLYTNGVLAAGPWTKAVPALNNNSFTLGGGYAGSDGRAHDGKLDECRAESVARSANWLWACWRNQSAPNQFMSVSEVTWLGAPLAVGLPRATGVGAGSATLLGKVLSDGGNGVTAWGTVWGTTPTPTENLLANDGSGFAPLNFSQGRTGFAPGTHYYFRAYASNAVEGAVYSTDGEFYTKPDAATAAVFSAVGNNGMTISWTPPGSYSGSVVVLREGSAVTATPQDGIVYTANAVFERGADLGSGQYVVYDGPGNSVTVSGLVPGATYSVAVYTYAGAGALINYQQAAPAAGTQATTSAAAFGIAGQLLIDMNVTRGLEANEYGQITNWVNYGTVGGSFAVDGDASTAPTYTTQDGMPVVSFNGANRLKSTFASPGEITGVNPQGQPDDYSMEMWVLNPTVADQEWVFSWAWRGTTARCAAFGYGYNGTYGALGHWGPADVAFSGGLPSAGAWHYIVATYDGTNNYVYVDGVLNTTKENILNLWDGGPCVLGNQYNMPFSYGTVPYSGLLTSLRVHSRCLSPGQVALNYTAGPLNPFTPVNIVTQPASRVVGEHENVTFAVVTAGEPPIAYQWYKNGSIVEGATGSTYTLPDVTVADSGTEVYVVCSNNSGGTGHSVTSDSATVRVVSATDSIMHRYSFNGDARDTVGSANGLIMVGATNDGTAVYLDGTNGFVDLPNDLFVGYTSLTFEAWATDNGSLGWARLWDFGTSTGGEGNGGTGSSYMFLAWPNGSFSGIRGAYKLPTTGEQYVDGNMMPAVSVKHHIVWTQDGLGKIAKLYVDGVLVGQNTGFSFTPAELGSTFNNWLGRSQFAVDAYFKGSIDEFRVYNVALSSNQVSASYANGPDASISIGPVKFQSQPRSLTVGEYGDASFGVFARGEQPLSFQWYRNDAEIAGATANTYTFPSAQFADSGSTFYCVVSNYALGTPTVVTSEVATLTVVRADTSLTHRYSFTTDATDSVGTAHGTLIGGLITNGMVTLPGVSNNYVELPAGVISGYSALTIEFWASVGTNNIWPRIYDFGDQNTNGTGHHYIFFTPHSGSLDARMSIADGEPTGNTHEQVVTSPGVLDGLGMTHVACVYDPANSVARLYTNGVLANSSAITIPLSNINNTISWLGRSLYTADAWLNASIDEFRIYNAALSSGKILQSYQQGPDFVLVDSPLVIVQQPQTQEAQLCSTINLGVRAGSPYPINYQWYWYGFPVSDATNSTYVIENAQEYLGGEYYVTVSNTLGMLTSDTMTLTIVDTQAPTITSCAANVTIAGDPTCTVALPDLVANLVATDCSLPLTITQVPAAGSVVGLGAHTVTLSVQDALGNKIDCTAVVTVIDAEPPVITAQPQNRSNELGTAATFEVLATSCAAITYQWYHDTTALEGQTSSSLSIANVQETHAGDYTVVLSNGAGSRTSEVARLTVIVNRPPVAQNDGLSTSKNQAGSITVAALLANDSDLDNDILTVQSVTPTSQNGGIVALAAGTVTYTPAQDFTGLDRFSYTVSDGRGGSATAEVAVYVVDGQVPAANSLLLTRSGSSSLVRFNGIPGTNYQVEYTDDIGGSWSILGTQVAPAHGIIELPDNNPSSTGDRFYRAVSVAP